MKQHIQTYSKNIIADNISNIKGIRLRSDDDIYWDENDFNMKLIYSKLDLKDPIHHRKIINERCKTKLLSFYLSTYHSFEVEEGFYDISNYDKEMDQRYDEYINKSAEDIINLFKKHMYDKDELRGNFKAYNKTNIVYYVIKAHRPKKIIQNNNIIVNIIIFDFDLINNICIYYEMNVIEEGQERCSWNTNFFTPMFISSKERYVSNYLENKLRKKIMHITNESVMITFTTIDMIKKCEEYCQFKNGNFKINNVIPNSKLELSLFRRQFRYDDMDSVDIVLFDYVLNKDSEHDNEIREWVSNNEVPEEAEMIDPKSPIIDLTEREIKFIINYIEDKGLTNENEPVYINLKEVLMTITRRYGNQFSMPIKFKTESGDLLKFTFIFYIQICDSSIEIYSKCIFGSNDIYLSALIWNIENFNFVNECIKVVSTSLNLKINNEMPNLYKDIYNSIDDFFKSPRRMIDILVGFLSIMITLYDRPKHYRTVTETKHSKSNNNSKSNRNRPKEESNVIIRRILKTSYGAKEYVKKMNAESSSDRIYTLEEWEREGHYRRKPNSQETIWIEPTTCHRRLKLSNTKNKEIHIKL